MKNILLLMLMLLAFGCENKGESKLILEGSQTNIPELKSLKVWSISLGGFDNVKIGILNDQPFTIERQDNVNIALHTKQINNTTEVRIIRGNGIIFENDSIIMIRKYRNTNGKEKNN